MTQLKFIQGHYNDVTADLFPSQVSTSPKPDELEGLINRDSNRMAYLAKEGATVELMKSELCVLFFYNNTLENNNNTYSQGDFDARGMSYKKILLANRSTDSLSPSELKICDASDPIFHENGLCYTNDAGVFCGIGISLLRDESNIEMDIAHRPHHYAITIIENVTACPKDRTVTYIAHPKLLGSEIQSTNLESDAVLTTLESALKSSLLKQALLLVLSKEGDAKINAFHRLNACLKMNKDARPLLMEWIILETRFQRLEKEARASRDSDYEARSISMTLQKNGTPSFFKRNQAVFFSAFTAVMAAIAAMLLLAILPIVNPVIVGIGLFIIGLICMKKIMNDEKAIQVNNKKDRESLFKITTDCQGKINGFEAELNTAVKDLVSDKPQNEPPQEPGIFPSPTNSRPESPGPNLNLSQH